MTTNIKPFVGVINSWGITNLGRIVGMFVCGEHPKAPYNGIAPGYSIDTSPVVSVTDRQGYYEVETRNSRYLCMGKPNYDNRPV